MKTDKIEMYEAKDGWRWRMIAKNGRIVSESGEAYARKGGCLKAIQRMREIAVVAVGPDSPAIPRVEITTLEDSRRRFT